MRKVERVDLDTTVAGPTLALSVALLVVDHQAVPPANERYETEPSDRTIGDPVEPKLHAVGELHVEIDNIVEGLV